MELSNDSFIEIVDFHTFLSVHKKKQKHDITATYCTCSACSAQRRNGSSALNGHIRIPNALVMDFALPQPACRGFFNGAEGGGCSGGSADVFAKSTSHLKRCHQREPNALHSARMHSLSPPPTPLLTLSLL